MCLVNLSCRGIGNCKWNPQIVSGIRNVSGIRKLYKIAESTYFCGIRLHLRNPEPLLIYARCGIRNKIIVPKNITLQIFVCGLHAIFVSGIHLEFETYFKTCFWNSGTYRLECTVWPRNANIKRADIWKIFKLSLIAGELEQI